MARSLFHKQHVYYHISIKIQQSFHLGHSALLLRRAQMSTGICIKLFTRRSIKCRDRRGSLSISLNFYQTIQESSSKMRLMFDIKKLLLIDALTFIPGETQDDLLTIVIDLPEFCQIPKGGPITDYSKAESTVCNVALLRNSVCYSLCCISLRHDNMKLIYSCGILFLIRV